VLFDNNDIDHNNPSFAVSPGFEAGGGKCSNTTGLIFRNNNSYNNNGPGLWTDINNIHTTYVGNNVADNWGPGIFHEISYDAVIVNNVIRGNGFGEHNGWLWDAGIQISSSGAVSAANPMDISGNIVTDNYNGIALLQQKRLEAAAYGPHTVQNVFVHDNVVTMNTGESGAVQDLGDDSIFSGRNNRYVANTYHVSAPTAHWFAWLNGGRSWPEWQAYGEDLGGKYLSP
jgi:parallel beta-helix repeat protein